MERRNLFRMIFGGKAQPKQTTGFEMLSTSIATFYAWDGNLYANDIVRSCIRPKANAVGKMRAVHVRETPEALRVSPAPWIRALLEQPNQYMTMQDFLSKMVTHRELNHNAFAYVARDEITRRPIGIYPMPYSTVEIVNVDGEMYVRFRFNTGKQVVVPYSDCIHLRKDFNSSDVFGDTGTDALTNIMDVITTTDQGVVNAIKNSAFLRWLLKFKSILKPEDKAAAVQEFVDNYLAVTNSGGAAATDPRYDAEQVKSESFVPDSLQMTATVQRLYAYFGVNDAIVQNKFDGDQFNAFYEAELEPIAIQLSNAFTNVFFTPREKAIGNRIMFEASNLAYAPMSEKLQFQAMVDRGAMTPNEWRRVMNLGPLEGGDVPIRRLDTQEVTGQTTNGGVDDGTANKSA